MPDPTLPTTDTDIATSTGGTAVKTALIARRDIYHEFGSELEDRVATATVEIDPQAPPVRVEVQSHVLFSGRRVLRSPAYLASVRRREAGRISQLVASLDQHADKDDFEVWTHDVLGTLRRLIRNLSDAEEDADVEHEGNSCEILRQLRDTLLNTGWQRYREQDVRKGVVEILKRLASADEVTADDAYRAMDRLLDLNLDPTVGFAGHNGEEEEILD